MALPDDQDQVTMRHENDPRQSQSASNLENPALLPNRLGLGHSLASPRVSETIKRRL